MSFCKYLREHTQDNDINLFIREYPFIFQQIPDEIMSCKKIKSYLHYNNYYDICYVYRDRLFSKIWMKYFKWKLMLSENNNEFIDR